MDRYLTRIKIEPCLKAIINLYAGSKHVKDIALKNLVLSEYYGIRSPLLHDDFKANHYVPSMKKSYIDCLNNTRIYMVYSYNSPVEKTCYIYNTEIKDNYLYVEKAFSVDSHEPLPKLPEIKKGTYSAVTRYREFLEKLNERRSTFNF